MATWTNQTRNVTTYTNASRHSTTFTNAARSLITFGSLTYDQIGAMTYDGLFQGKPVGDYTYDDLIGPSWTNQTRN